MVTFDPGDPLNGLFADQRAAEEARRRLPVEDPVVTTSPPVGSDHLVGLPTYLAVGPRGRSAGRRPPSVR
jgi:hypothetical protein